MAHGGNRLYKKNSRIQKMITKVFGSTLLIGFLCFSFVLFTIAGRLFLRPDEHVENIVRKVMSPVKSFVEDAFSGSENQEKARVQMEQMELISGKGFSFQMSEDGVIRPYAPYHITLTYTDTEVPRDIGPRLKGLVDQALGKIWLIPNALNVAMGRFMVLTFLKDYVTDKRNPLTLDEEKALKVMHQFSPNKENELPHISLIEWISGKEKRLGLKEAVMSDPEEIDAIITGTRGQLERLVQAMGTIETKDSLAQKTVRQVYEALTELRSYLNFPALTFSDGRVLDFGTIDQKGWTEFFNGGDGVQNRKRIGELATYLNKTELRKKPLMKSMKPVVSEVTKMARQIEGEIRDQFRQEAYRPSLGEEAGAAAAPRSRLYEEAEYERFQAGLADEAGFKEWYGTRQMKTQEDEGGAHSASGGAAQGGSPVAEEDEQETQKIEAARVFYQLVGSITASLLTGRAGENWPGLLKKDRKPARKALEKLGKALEAPVPNGADVEQLVQALKVYTGGMSLV